MIRIFILILVAVLQLGCVGLMIHGRERVLAEGVEMKFVAAPVDPADFFRGRYVRVSFEAAQFKSEEELPFEWGQTLYALLEADEEGYASMKALVAQPPADGTPYLKIREWYGGCAYHPNPETEKIKIRGWICNLIFPFDRYYMNEKAAPEAERLYRETLRRNRDADSGKKDEMSRDNYLVVRILNGEAVPVELYLDGKTVESQVCGKK